MIFTQLVLENFGAYAKRNVINLRPADNNLMSSIVLFGGMNGGGKTTLMDAIRLALYGQRAKCSTRGNLGYGNFLTQSINSQAEGKELTVIELSFEYIVDHQWKEFHIIRAWDKNHDGKDSLSVKVDNDYDDALAKTWDEYVENILPLGISNLFLFDGEQVKELAELDTPPQSVVEAISNLLGLELAEKLAVDLEVLLSRKRKSLASKSQLKTIEEIEARLTQLEQRKQESLKTITEAQQQLVKAQKKQKTAYNKFRTEGGKIAADRSKLEAEISDTRIQIEQQRNALIELSATSLPLQLILPLLQQAELQANQEIKREQLQQAQNVIKQRDDRLFIFLEQLPLSAEHLDKIDFFLEQEDRKLDEVLQLQGKAYLGIDDETLKQFSGVINNQLPLKIQQTRTTIAELRQREIELVSLEKQLAIAAPPEAYQKLNDALTTAQKKLDKCQLEYDRAQYLDRQLEREIDSTKKELKNYSESNISIANDEHIINSVAKVQKTLDEFRERLTLKKLNKLEVEVTECFRYLLHKTNLVHKVVIDRDSFRISLYDPQGQFLPKQRLSAGEKQLLAIAFLWGLARVSGRNLPIAIDTPLGRLDSSHRHNLVERYFPTASHQVILLSTDTEIGKQEVNLLREQEVIAQEYLLEYSPDKRQTTVKQGYFW
ncbi:DNA sulfur modification protein DndD [Pleurocapsales cyanobacterium LEGE 10410]|nr:DNA sulfur modification protein DndD [Pleurocapsales cyanobacterium LEGE 10410]